MPESAAIRECIEEAGIRCINLRPLLSYEAGLDALHNPTHIFYTSEFEASEIVEPDPREVWEQHWITLTQAIQMVFSGQIVDALSVVALLTYDSFGRREISDGRILDEARPIIG